MAEELATDIKENGVAGEVTELQPCHRKVSIHL